MEWTAEAKAEWESLSEEDRDQLLATGFCTRCLATRRFTPDEGEMRGEELALIGQCDTCGARVVRLVTVTD